MGQSTPTTTDALDHFVSRYGPFRAELDRPERKWFDELVCRARRHSTAINRRPDMDFERSVTLAMLLEGMRIMDDQSREMALLRSDLKEAQRALADAGLAVRRVPAPPPLGLGGVGQARLTDIPVPRAVPA